MLLYESPTPPSPPFFSFCRTHLRETHDFGEYFDSITLGQGPLNYIACVPNLAYHLSLNEVLLEHNHPHSFYVLQWQSQAAVTGGEWPAEPKIFA